MLTLLPANAAPLSNPRSQKMKTVNSHSVQTIKIKSREHARTRTGQCPALPLHSTQDKKLQKEMNNGKMEGQGIRFCSPFSLSITPSLSAPPPPLC